jgi:hypothetical protein
MVRDSDRGGEQEGTLKETAAYGFGILRLYCKRDAEAFVW